MAPQAIVLRLLLQLAFLLVAIQGHLINVRIRFAVGKDMRFFPADTKVKVWRQCVWHGKGIPSSIGNGRNARVGKGILQGLQ
eukprot:5747672-Amphidinium_carterae.1